MQAVHFSHALAIRFIFLMWASYGPLLQCLGRGTLNAQLHVVRLQWMKTALESRREGRIFDGVLLGQISSQLSFFGSATMIVLAGLVGSLVKINEIHAAVQLISWFPAVSAELFSMYFAALTAVVALSFFSFTYALRHLGYALALLGGLPEIPCSDLGAQAMTRHAACVLTESVKQLNNGIRGYYFAAASVFLVGGPAISIAVTLSVSMFLVWRQLSSPVSRAISGYVVAMQSRSFDAMPSPLFVSSVSESVGFTSVQGLPVNS